MPATRFSAVAMRPLCVFVECFLAVAVVVRQLKLSNFPGGARQASRRDAPEESGLVRFKKSFSMWSI